MIDIGLVIPTVINMFLCFMIIFGNSNIILATMLNKSLRSPCNFMILFNAFGDMTVSYGQFVFTGFLFSDHLYTTRLECFYWQAVPVFMSIFDIAVTLAIGFDRMIGIVAPIR
jgi:hypothetical protein